MKKWLLAFVVLLIAILGMVYLFVPSNLKISRIDFFHTSEKGAIRYISNPANWGTWWKAPEIKTIAGKPNAFEYDGDVFEATHVLQNGVEITIGQQGATYKSHLTLLPINKDSTAVQWKCERAQSGNNPINRVVAYRQALSLTKKMTAILSQLKIFLEQEANIYGITITHEFITDTLLLAEKRVFTTYPDTKSIYEMVDNLRNYITTQGAITNGQPMLNVSMYNNAYETMVALPLSKPIADNGNMQQKHMVPKTPIVSAIAVGGQAAMADVLLRLEHYKLDNQIQSPGLPYNILLTDRRLEPDSTKWKTKVCNLLFPWFR